MKLFSNKKERNKQSNFNIITEKCKFSQPLLYSHELLGLSIINGKSATMSGNLNNEDIYECLLKMKDYLSKVYIIPTNSIDNYEKKQNLSSRQICCSKLCGEYLIKQEFVPALHELLDCINDYGYGLNESRLITIEEYSLYLSLINGFIACLTLVDKFNV